ncbi:hypothetical protein GCM10027190_05260 [Spirosoma areae]
MRTPSTSGGFGRVLTPFRGTGGNSGWAKPLLAFLLLTGLALLSQQAYAQCTLTGVGTAPICSGAAGQYALTGSVFLSNVTAAQTLTITVGAVSTTTSVGIGTTSRAYTVPGLSGTGSQTVTVTSPTCGVVSATFTAPASCPACSIALSPFSVNTNCNPANNTYTVTGAINLVSSPAQSLTITDSGGTSTTVGAGVGTTSVNFTLNGLSPASGTHTITVTSPTCGSFTTTYTAPTGPCTCSMTLNKVTVSGCYSVSGVSLATVSVEVGYTNPPRNTIDSLVVTLGGQTRRVRINTYSIQYPQPGGGFNSGNQVIVSPQVVAFEVPANSASGPITARFNNLTACQATGTYTAPGPCPPLVCSGTALGGIIYNDYNNDGTRQAGETNGVAAITVRAIATNGTAYTTTTDANGLYALTIPAANYPVRVEFGNIPSAFNEGFAGPNSGTRVQFIGAPSCTVDLGLSNPASFCQSAPPLFIPCYVSGDPLVAGDASTADAFVSFPYGVSGTQVGEQALATTAQIGTAWGVAWNKNTKRVFTSATLKRHAGLGPAGLGGIYVVNYTNPASPVTSTFLSVTSLGINVGSVPTNTARGLTGDKNTPSADSLAFALTGKVGIGDLDISEDNSTLYFTNLFDQKLYAIDITQYNLTGALPTAANVTSFAIPASCTGGNYRPWAIKPYNGKVYVGGVCDALSSQNKSNLRASVFELNGATFTNIFDFPLTYPKGYGGNANRSATGWYPWTDNFDQLRTITGASSQDIIYPQPIFADIEFDIDGSMVLGFGDRTGFQGGEANLRPDPTNDTRRFTVNPQAGDILRAYAANGAFVLENNAKAGPAVGAGVNNNQGPGFGEFYADNNGTSSYAHTELALGGLALRPGSGEVVAAVIDPIDNQSFAGGVRNFNNTTGLSTVQYTVYIGVLNNTGQFSKATGLGDIELGCDAITRIEIGNRVWLDTDQDGTQDPNESPLAGVNVSLYKAGVLIATTTTNAQGNYYFSAKSLLASGTWSGTGADTTLLPNTAYQVAFGTGGQFAASQLTVGGAKYQLTTANNTTAVNANDQNDSDPSVGTVAGVTAPIVSLTTGNFGASDHSFDAGFFCLPFASTLTSASICIGQSLTLTATGGTSYTFSNGTTNTTGLLVVSPTSTTAYQVTVAVGNCTSTTTATVTVNPLPTPVLPSVSICVGQTATLTATGGTSYTFSTGLVNTTGQLTVSPTTTTPYSVTVANASGCISTTSGTVTVNPLPTATLTPASICAGQTATLTATGGTSYTFSTGLVNTSGLLTVSPTLTTTYSVTVASSTGCLSTTTAAVTVNPAPTALLTSASICAGQSVTLTATGGTSYTFSTGATNLTGILIVNPATTTPYSVTVANASGCVSTTTATVTVNPLPTAGLTSVSICAGQTASLTATGGTSYTFSTGLVNTTGILTVSPASTTPYSVTVANASGCISTTSGTVTVNPAPTAGLSSVSICAGQTATLTATGGTSYTFSTGLINTTGILTVSPASTTPYSVTVGNATGCISTTTATVTVNPLPTAMLTPASICPGQMATLTATGGTSYTFSTGLVNTSGLLTVSPTTTTPYSVTVANASGCVSTTTATVTVNPLPIPALTSASICVGQTATLTATGGTSYTFSTGLINTTGILTVSPTMTTPYSVTVANASGCISTTSGTVTVNPLPTATLTPASICAGQTATLTATGGTSYTFSTGLVNTSGLLTVSPTLTTTYSVTVASSTGCLSTTTAAVTVNPAPTAGLTSASICVGQTVSLTASGGTSYTFSTGLVNTSGLLTVSPTTTTPYSVTVGNASGCVSTTTATVTINPSPVASVTATSLTLCAGQSTTLTASGGTAYLWSTGASTPSITVNPTTTTTYSVTVTNASGCASTTSVTVTVNGQPQIVSISQSALCVGNIASLTINATNGGSGTLEYSINGGAFTTGSSFTVNAPVSTTVTVVARTQGSICTDSDVVVVNCACQTPASLTLLPATLQTCGRTPVSLTVNVSGAASASLTTSGTGTFSPAVISGSQTVTYQPSAADTQAGSVTLTLTSADPDGPGSCVAVQTSRELILSPVPSVSISAPSTTICAGQSVVLTATGASTYVWSTGETTQSISVSVAGTYSVTGTSLQSCTATASATVTVNPAPTAGLTSVSICAGQLATLTATGGTSYSFSTGDVNTTGILTISPTTTTPYSVTVGNASGCRSTTTATVTVNPVPTATLTSVSICAGQTATLTATGGTSYTFSTGDVNTTGILTVSPASTTPYSVTVGNASGCRSTTTATVTVNPLPTATLTPASICAGQMATLTATGGTSYTFSTGDVNLTGLLTVSPTTTTPYSVTVGNASGCRSTTTATVTVTPVPTLGVTGVACAGLTTFNVTFTATVGATIGVNLGSLTGNTVTGVPSGQPLFITATLNSCSAVVGPISQNCQSNAASLGDFVFVDQNRDGIQQPGETPIPGVVVVLLDGTNTPIRSTTTNASGLYSFTGLTPGVPYSVSFVAPTGYTSTSAQQGGDDTKDSDANPVTGQTRSVTLAPGENNPNLDAGFYIPTAGLGDFVFVDTNKNGVQDGGDTPIAGVTVTLYINGTATTTTTTDATGFYSFTGLTPGNSTSYSVGFTAPAGFTATLQNAGGDDTKDSDADVITGRTQSVTLAPGEFNPTLDAGYYLIPASLGDYVFRDNNQDGIQNGGDTPIAGVTVTLYINGVASLTTLTNASGLYSFTGLTPGNSLSYSVGFGTPAGLTPTLANQGGNDGLDSDADLITGRTQSVTLAPGENNPTLDAGFYLPAVPTAGLGDYVFRDTNQNGIQDGGDTPIPGVLVTLYTNGVASLTTLTDGSGAYSFTGLTPGNSLSYSVGFGTPSGLSPTTANVGANDAADSDADVVTGRTQSVTLANGEFNSTLDAGFFAPCSVLTPVVTAGLCLTATNTFSSTVVVTVNNPAGGQTLTISDGASSQPFTTTAGSSNTFTMVFNGLASDGSTRTVTVSLPGCGSATAQYTAPASCSIAPPACSIANPSVTVGPCLTATNTYSTTAVVTLLNTSAGVLTVSNGASSLTTTVAGGLSSFTFTAVFNGLVSDGLTRTVTASLPGCGTATAIYTAPVSCSIAPTAGLGDYVFRDTNQNGIQDGGDTPIPGVLVTLYTNGVASLTTLTNASGLYSFTGLTPGNSLSYSVGFGTPAGLTPTLANQGGNDGLDSDADLITGRTQSVTLAPGENNPTLDAGFIAPVAPVFDLALRKTLAAGQSTTLTAGSSVTFTITVFNQGNVTATAINLVDLIPVGLTLNDPNWTAVTSTTATLNTPIASLSAGASTTRNIVFTINAGTSGPIVNRAEIASAQGGTDIDSSPDANPGNDAGGTPNSGSDDTVNGNGTGSPGGIDPTTDEDDSDPAFVMVLAATPPTLTLEKLVNLSVAQVGNVLTYSLVLTNTGSVSATTTVRDSLSGGSTYVPASASAPAGTTFTPGTPESLWTVPSIAAGQSLTLTFQVRVDSTGILYNTASIPGDTAKVCTSVPIKLCPGDEYTLTAPAGRASYTWYRNGVLIVGATTNSLTVTQGGSYSLSVSGAGSSCPDFSCCPVIVEVDSLPVFTAVAIPATCLGNVPQANGRLVISGFNAAYTYQYSAGATFNPAASLSGPPQVIPAGGVLVSNLVSPASATAYTVRVYNSSGCYTDMTVMLIPTVCGCPADVCVPYVIQQTKRPRRIGDPIR